MKKSAVAHIIGLLLIFLAFALLVPLAVAYYYDSQAEIPALASSIGISFAAGLALFLIFKKAGRAGDMRVREAFAVVALGWATLSAFGALPFWLAPATIGIPQYVDAYFETMSGFTTTGASILSAPAELPRGLLFWRSFTHWFGGMGIIVLTVAILPFLGAGGAQLMRAEVPGPTADKLGARMTETAKILWLVYVLLTCVHILLLLPVMDLFDAACQTFGTMATGGFSTRNSSIESFDSLYVEMIILFFMVASGASFVLHYHLLSGRGLRHFMSSEFRFYMALIGGAIVIVTFLLWWDEYPQRSANPEKYSSVWSCLRYASFQVVSILTTTGYGTADFDRWPNACRFILLILMFVGGCAGSTGGGVKCVRVLLMFKYGVREILQLIRPHAVLQVKMEGRVIGTEVVGRVMGFFALWFVSFVVAVLLMSMILDPYLVAVDASPAQTLEQEEAFETAFGSVLATMGNIGPGIAAVGPVENYSQIPTAGKWLLIFCMLLGRLEIYSVLILLAPAVWRS